MHMIPAKSSNIAATGYDMKTGDMRVEFKNGKVYDYHDVPPAAHSRLIAAESIGRHLATHFHNKFRFTRIA